MFLLISDMQNVQLQTVPNPCLDTTPQSTIADMCTTNYATEDNKNGGTTVDTVALRVKTQQDGCTCEVTLLNQTNVYTIYMRKYDLVTSAAPEHAECGLAVDIEYHIPNNLPENKFPIECTKGIDTRSITLSNNEILYFKSRIIAGSFSRGYCIQIYRKKENDMLPVIITAVIGWCLTAIFAITACYLYRRHKPRPNIAGEQNSIPQYEDLHATRISSNYSSLNTSTVNEEQNEHI
ncbi:unnamed protein product [Mytilus coruscus]|uniref:Uncharacterized protein n=1 Tax=Mytilus coruscus TaxID=42192 RepID=A0A6J8DBR5_MYTCO|nr:unnamed protein product [Mytilus coruscus]